MAFESSKDSINCNNCEINRENLFRCLIRISKHDTKYDMSVT